MKDYRYGDLSTLSKEEIEELRKDAELRYMVGIITHRDQPLSKKDQAPLHKLFPTIFSSITSNDMALLKNLINPLDDLNILNRNGQGCLHVAACCNNTKALSILLSKGADINLPQAKNGWSALHTAVWFGDYKVVAYLIKKGANVNLQCKMGQTPLMVALDTYDSKRLKAHQAIIRTLLKNGATTEFSKENAMPAIVRYMQNYIKKYLKK